MIPKNYNLYIKGKDSSSSYIKSDENDFTLSYSEQKSSEVTIMKGRLTANVKLELFWLDVIFKESLEGLSFHANGFQSWSESPLIKKGERIKKLAGLPGRIFKLKNFGDYNFNGMAEKTGDAYSHMYLDLQHGGETQNFYGDLMIYDSYTMFSVDYENNLVTAGSDLDGLVLEAGETIDIFSICKVPDCDTWFSILGIDRLPADKLTGWTSWYNYYTKITEYILESNMKAITDAGLLIDAFQIDDGYFTHVGDWLEPNDRFPGGMKALATQIKKHGWIPGIWSAPFVADIESFIFKDHSDWILRTKKGKLQIAGWNPNWTGVFYALDIYNDELREYLKQVYKTTIEDWGYSLLKLDFLYAAGLQPRPGKTRCMVMSDAMDLLLEITEGARILACGAPLAPVMGKCHYCRIGGDISHGWEDILLKSIHYRERVSTASSLGNTLSRFMLNGKAFLNDPDVFILRDTKEIKMTLEQKNILFRTNMEHSGLVFYSDDLSTYDEETLQMVKEAFKNYKEGFQNDS